MNWYFKSFWTATLIASVSFMITACSKKEDSRSSLQGNITTNGQGVYSNSTLNGRPIQINVSNIQKAQSYTTQYPQTSAVTFTVEVNGRQTMMNANAVPVGMQSQGIPGVMIGDFDLWYEARCVDQMCDRLSLGLWATVRNGQEWKQIGVLKTMSQNIISAGFEITGLFSSLIVADQVPAQLNRLVTQ